jgi:hypothetical protein
LKMVSKYCEEKFLFRKFDLVSLFEVNVTISRLYCGEQSHEI